MTLPIQPLERHDDARGSLVVLQPPRGIPFDIRRTFWIFGTTPTRPRGGHAARTQHEFLVCVAGRCRIDLASRQGRRSGVLDRPDRGVLVPPGTWIDLTEMSEDCVLLVLSDGPYDPADSVTDRAEFELMIS